MNYRNRSMATRTGEHEVGISTAEKAKRAEGAAAPAPAAPAAPDENTDENTDGNTDGEGGEGDDDTEV